MYKIIWKPLQVSPRPGCGGVYRLESGNAVDDELAKLKGKKATGRGNSMEVGHGAIKIAGL